MSGPISSKMGLALLGVLAGALVLAAVALLARGGGNAPILIVTPTPGTMAASSLQSPTPENQLKVHIKGEVRNPGVYELRPGDRLDDALAAAGGPTEDADRDALNLAERVKDGVSYYVPKIGETPRPVVKMASDSSSPRAPGSLIDLNTASLEALMSLPGIGQVKAQAIVDFRELNREFSSVEDIKNVKGIGEVTYQNIKDLVTVS